jgi:glycosyltransferase involved in cell wall biosynthesis
VRIVLVGPAHPYKGGGARHTTDLAHRLAAAGHDVVIESWRAQYPARLYPGQQTIEEPEGEPYPRTRHRLAWYRPDGWLTTGRRLASADLVIFVLLTPLQVPAYLAILASLRLASRPSRSHRPRTVVICHNVLPHERRTGDVMLTRILLAHVDTVLTHSPAQAELARTLAPAVSVVTARMPPHLPCYPGGAGLPGGATPRNPPLTGGLPAPPSPPGPPAGGRPGPLDPHGRPAGGRPGSLDQPLGGTSLNGSGAGVRLLFFGIVRPYKGLDVLLRALARAPEHLTLTVAGEFWGGTARTEKLIAELGLQDRVRLRPGYVPASGIPALFAAADVLVLPYREATASQNALLAFAHGVPVITTTAGVLADLVRNGVDGLTCAPGDVADLARVLREISGPGTAGRLRAGVTATDPEPGWADYLQALLGR